MSMRVAFSAATSGGYSLDPFPVVIQSDSLATYEYGWNYRLAIFSLIVIIVVRVKNSVFIWCHIGLKLLLNLVAQYELLQLQI